MVLPFHHFKYIVPLPPGLQSFCEKSADNLMGVPLYIICCFSLVAFNILSLYVIFVILITMHLGVFLFGFILFGTLSFLDLDDCLLSQVREVFNLLCFQIFPKVLSLSLFLLGPL